MNPQSIKTNEEEIDWIAFGWEVAIERYESMKSKSSNTLLLYKIGSLYYAFGEDALILCLELRQVLYKTETPTREVHTVATTKEALDQELPQLLKKGYAIATYDRPYHRVETLRSEVESCRSGVES